MAVAPETVARNDWAAPSVATSEAMAIFQNGLPVRLVATPREALRTCRSDESLAEVTARNTEGFDYLPVTDPDSDIRRIVGVLELTANVGDISSVGIVRDRMQRLTEDNLIGADASILAFLRGADQRPCRLVMSGTQISGLVSLSDLQQLPVRAALFALITQLEMSLAECIRREYAGSDQWKERLSLDRRGAMAAKRAQSGDNRVDDLLFSQFGDKVTVIRKSPSFSFGKNAFESDMRVAQNLRDDLAHANEYAATREAAAQVCRTVRKIETWIECLTAWAPQPISAKG